MRAGGREQTMQYMAAVRLDGLEQCVISAAAQLLGSGGSRRQITESLRFRDEALESTALASVRESPPSGGSVH